ncbi:MAG: PadR family transcriptional regulator [Gemmatimonadales bacterium]|nr:PadR family transcriptional regulator [Gemmatimonadota bacterium]MDX2059514.1 PadR family transcriptional regulator [Gemmatimonadales bacterium]
MSGKPTSLLQGTLDLIVLQLLRDEPTNGYELAQRIATVSRDVLTVNAGSLYPALYRLEARGLIRAAWEESKTGRRVKVYSLTPAGRKELAAQRGEWARFTGALGAILGDA